MDQDEENGAHGREILAVRAVNCAELDGCVRHQGLLLSIAENQGLTAVPVMKSLAGFDHIERCRVIKIALASSTGFFIYAAHTFEPRKPLLLLLGCFLNQLK